MATGVTRIGTFLFRPLAAFLVSSLVACGSVSLGTDGGAQDRTRGEGGKTASGTGGRAGSRGFGGGSSVGGAGGRGGTGGGPLVTGSVGTGGMTPTGSGGIGQAGQGGTSGRGCTLGKSTVGNCQL